MYKASETLTGIADVNTGLKFLDKTTVVPYDDDQAPLRGQLELRRRRQGLGRPAVSTSSDDRPGAAGAGRTASTGPGPTARARRELARRLLTLREGSIIVDHAAGRGCTSR